MQEMCIGCAPGCPVTGCPYYTPQKGSHKCSICGEWIEPGDEYLKNDYGDCIHYECADTISMRQLLKWLGYQILYDNGE